MTPEKPIGLILSAGFSSRAKTNKMLFPINGKCLIKHTIERMRPFVKEIYIVTGHYDVELREALKDISDINFIYNKDYAKGMYGSILCGIRHTEGDILLIPGDVGFVSSSTYEAILNGEGNFRTPIYKDQPGHPIFISHKLREDILNHPDLPNMRTYRNMIGYTKIPVDDMFVTLDVDTREDLENIKKLLKENSK